jgi:hypothetical protein
MRLIGLNGRLHSGKDSAVQFIREGTNERVTRAAFADKLKLSAAHALGLNPVDTAAAVSLCNLIKEQGHIVLAIDGDPKDFYYISGREFLQVFGTESHRDVFGYNFWVDALLPVPDIAFHEAVKVAINTLQQRYPDTDVLVITDVRFENEAQRILNLGGEIWWIDAEARLGPLPEDAHVSEHPLESNLITTTVDNNYELQLFRLNIMTALYG